MEAAITKLGRNPLSAICAALFAYVIIGGVVGSAIAVSDNFSCWPQAIFHTVYASCDDPVKRQLWFLGVGLPNVLISNVVRIVLALTTDAGEGPIGVFIMTLNGAILAFVTFFGFAGWYARLPLVAWTLLLALIGEAIYLRTLVPV